MAYTEDQYRELLGNARHNLALPKKPSKYRNVRCEVNGETFDSKREADYWILLKARERAGEITQLRRQVPFALHCPVYDVNVDSIIKCPEVCQYIADFCWTDRDGHKHTADSKGVRTQIFRLKAKWMALEYGITIELV